jgi:uncharacterized protein (TIGR03546 family)
MFIIQYLSKLIKIIRSAASPSQIAGGLILGMMIGLSPSFLTLTNLFMVLLLIILNVNIATALFSYAIFSGIAYLLDPWFHSLGYHLLVNMEGLRGLWAYLYKEPVVPYTRFNNTVVMGSFVISLLLLIPVYFLSKLLVIKYREKLEPKVKNWKWVKLLKSNQVYQLYEKLKFFGE